MQGRDAGVVVFQVRPEQPCQLQGQAVEGAVVEAGPAFGEVVDDQIPDRPGPQVVAVDEFAGRVLSPGLPAQRPQCRRGVGTEDAQAVQQHVEQRLARCALRADTGVQVVELHAVPDGDVGDAAALAGQDDRDPRLRRLGVGVDDRGIARDHPIQRGEPLGVPILRQAGRQRARAPADQPCRAGADHVRADQHQQPGTQNAWVS